MKVEKSSLTVQVNKERDPYDLVTKRITSIKDKEGVSAKWNALLLYFAVYLPSSFMLLLMFPVMSLMKLYKSL
ncbi:hypothetical protein V3595_00305 [Bacillus sp. CFBP9009]